MTLRHTTAPARARRSKLGFTTPAGPTGLRLTFTASLLLAALAVLAPPSHAADSVAGIELYPGALSTNVEGSEKVLKDSGYPVVVCRHTADSPWINMKTMQMTSGTMICIAGKSGK